MAVTQPRTSWLVTLGQAIAWLIASLGAIADALYIREAFDALLALFQVIHTEYYHQSGGLGIDLPFSYQLTAYDETLLFVLAIAAVAVVVAIEYYFRRGRPKGLLARRVGIVFGVEIAIIAVSILIRLLV